MNTLKAMEVFVAVAEHEGFSPAARALNMSTTAVSRYIQEFEDWLGVDVFRRTTRKISLTQAGQAQLAECQRIVNDVEAVKANTHADDLEPTGTLRITAPVFVAKGLLAGLLPAYLNTYPKIDVELLAIDRPIDLVAEGFDLAVRVGDLADSSLHARKLGDVSLFLVASPDYLTRHGVPNEVRDLVDHNCIIDTVPAYGDRWPISDASYKKHFRAKGNVRVNSGEIAESMTLNGAGISYLPDFFVHKHITDGRLVRLLDTVQSPVLGMYIVYPQSRHLHRETRSLIDFVVGHVSHLKDLYSSR